MKQHVLLYTIFSLNLIAIYFVLETPGGAEMTCRFGPQKQQSTPCSPTPGPQWPYRAESVCTHPHRTRCVAWRVRVRPCRAESVCTPPHRTRCAARRHLCCNTFLHHLYRKFKNREKGREIKKENQMTTEDRNKKLTCRKKKSELVDFLAGEAECELLICHSQ